MKVKELIDALQHEDPEAPVVFAYPSGNYWGHTLASSPDCIGRGRVARENNGTVRVLDGSDDDDDYSDVREAVVMSEG